MTGALFTLALVVSLHFVFAQDVSLSSSNEEVALAAIESTTPTPASELPDCCNFISAQHALDWPPLPANIWGLNGWVIGGGEPVFIVLDDRTVDYDALRAQTLASMQTSGVALPSGGFSPMDLNFSSNDLWLEMTGVTNDMSYLVIHPPWEVTDGVYDLYLTTNLNTTDSSGLNGTNWLWVSRTDPGQTNLTVANPASDQCYFMLGLTNDADADGLSDAYEKLIEPYRPEQRRPEQQRHS